MKISNIILIVAGLIIILFCVFCPQIIAIHGIVWRIIIGLLGCFSLVSGVYKEIRKN